jgi:succinate dehydrogenase/fumarate reductase flavoprotein subunit
MEESFVAAKRIIQMKADTIMIGGGGAGLPAALTAFAAENTSDYVHGKIGD